MTDERTEEILAKGRTNQANFRLVTNWCSHIRIQRYGGVGMLEEATGVPIGNFGPECDHAGPDGSYSWDIRSSAVDFYDRHCHDCTLRQPVRDPNLSKWVTERDKQVAEYAAQESAAARAAADALSARRDERSGLRLGLSPAAADVVDQLDALDGGGTAILQTQFVETARLAPEAFPPAIIDYLFKHIEASELWIEDAALSALTLLGDAPARLVRVAAAALERGNLGKSAVKAFLRNRAEARLEEVAAVFPAFVELAEPNRQPFTPMRRAQRAPLSLLARSFPAEVALQIRSCLDNGSPGSVSRASRAAEALARLAEIVSPFGRDFVAAWVRAKWLPDPREPGHGAREGAARDLEFAVAELFRRDPETVDDLLQQYLAGASDNGEVRIFKIYHLVLSSRSFCDARPANEAEKVAFRRLLRAASKVTNWDVLSEIIHAFDGKPGRLIGLAEIFQDELLGTAIMMDERLVAFDAQPKPTIFLEVLERRNRRHSLERLRDTFVAWTAAGVAVIGDLTAYTKALENIPESRSGLAACMIEHAVGLAKDVAGLNAVLPVLYAALVGASVVGRGAAATAVGNLPANLRLHAPDLLYESFLLALTDPYVYVHKSALNALCDIRLPKEFDQPVRHALANMVRVYGSEAKDYDTVIKCIELLVGRYLDKKVCAGTYGAYLVSVMNRLPSWSLSSHMRYLARHLGRAQGVTTLLMRLLTDPEAADHQIEAALDALAELPNDVLHAERATLGTVTAEPSWETHRRVHGVVELLGRVGAWDKAVEVAERALSDVPDTRRERPSRRRMELLAAAANYERALAAGDADCATAAAGAWRALVATIERENHAT